MVRLRVYLANHIRSRTHTAPHDGQNTAWNRFKMALVNALDKRMLRPCVLCKLDIGEGFRLPHVHGEDSFYWLVRGDKRVCTIRED